MPLQWFGEIVGNHRLRWAPFCGYMTFVNVILDKKIPHVYMFGALTTAPSPIVLQQDGTPVVLVYQRISCTIPLLTQKVSRPKYMPRHVIDCHQFCFGRTLGVDLLLC